MVTKRYPLSFGYRDLVAGNGYVAAVAAQGRTLAVQEADGVWLYGVHPGGIAGGGATEAAAHEEFRRMFKAVLYDIAAEAVDFEDFRGGVEEFFEDVDRRGEQEWLAASRKPTTAGGSPFLVLPESSVRPPKIEIQEVSGCGPAVNALDEGPVVVCACSRSGGVMRGATP